MSASRLLLITGLVVLTMVGSAAKALGFIHMYIDAGHGGTDVGAEPGVGCNEKALNLKVAEALSVLLASEPGYATNHTHTLSRNSDVMVSLADRATEANDLSADMFLSIHHNGIWSAHTQFAMWQIIRSNNSQIAHWEGNKTLAQCIAAGVCASFASPAELTCKGGCLAGSEGCGDEDFYYVLGATNMPATISEAGPTGHEDVDEICSTSDPAWRDREASGHLYGIRCYFGDLAGSAIFSDYGAFGDTVYCETYNEIGTDSLSLWGFGSSGAYPDNGDLLHTSPGVGALSSLTRYEAVGMPPYDFYEWREHSATTPTMTTGPFGQTSVPEDYHTRYARGGTVDSVAWEEVAGAVAIEEWPGFASEANCADIVVYASTNALAEPIYQQIVLDAPGKRVRKVLAPTDLLGHPVRTAQACTNALASVIARNAEWNAACTSPTCREYPVEPGPEVYIVGDMFLKQMPSGLGTALMPVGVGTRSAEASELVCMGNCRSDYRIYDTDGDGVPNGPISRIPAVTASHATLAAAAARDVNMGRNVDQSWHVARLAGNVFTDDNAPTSILTEAGSSYSSSSFGLRPVLDELTYPPSGSGSDSYGSRLQAFSNQVAAGVREVFGYGGMTWTDVVPGQFIGRVNPYASGRLSTKSRIITWFPACAVHASWMSESESNRSSVRALMFGDSTKTMIAASVAHMELGWFRYHDAMGRLLLEAREDAADTDERVSVARIAYDAVINGIAQGGELAKHSLSLSAWGSYTLTGRGGIPAAAENVQADAGRTTAVLAWTEPEQVGGPADEYEIRYQAYSPLTESNFGSGLLVDNPPSPGPGGTNHCIELGSLGTCRAYYFAIRTRRGGAWSSISPVASASTTCSGSAIVMCAEGLLAGGGGGEEEARKGEVKRLASMVSTDRTKQVSVLDAPGSGHARDVCPVNATESTSGQVSLRLQQVGPRRTVLSSIGVGFIDHDAGASLVVLGDSIVAGVLERVESIAVDGAHEPQWSASEANDLALERGSVVDIANLQMDQAMILVFHGARRQPFTEREDADVHVLAYQGDVWVDVGPVKFRRGGGVVGVRVPRSQRLKLQVGRACTLWALGMMRAAETQALQPLELLGAWREHPGGEKQSIASVSGLRFDADDAVTLAYRSGADAEGRKREYFMLVEGFRDDAMGARGVTDDGAVSVAKWPLEFSPPRPVPSSGGVSFGFSVDTASEVDITIYDVSGKRVATVTSGRREAGRHHVHWDSRDDAGRRLAAGVYFGRLTVGKRTREQRVVLR